jgi:hypothetical protein
MEPEDVDDYLAKFAATRAFGHKMNSCFLRVCMLLKSSA